MLSVLAVLIAGLSLWFSIRGHTEARIIDYEDRRSEIVAVLERTLGQTDRLIHELRIAIREEEVPKIRVMHADQIHEALEMRDMITSLIDDTEALETSSDTGDRVAIEQIRTQALVMENKLQQLIEDVHADRQNQRPPGTTDSGPPPIDDERSGG